MLLTSAVFLAGCNQQSAQVPQPLTDANSLNTVVWARKMTGTYYCGDSYMFGRADGSYMKQATALDSGYQPAMGSYCTGPETPIAAKPRSDSDSAHLARHGIG